MEVESDFFPAERKVLSLTIQQYIHYPFLQFYHWSDKNVLVFCLETVPQDSLHSTNIHIGKQVIIHQLGK